MAAGGPVRTWLGRLRPWHGLVVAGLVLTLVVGWLLGGLAPAPVETGATAGRLNEPVTAGRMRVTVTSNLVRLVEDPSGAMPKVTYGAYQSIGLSVELVNQGRDPVNSPVCIEMPLAAQAIGMLDSRDRGAALTGAVAARRQLFDVEGEVFAMPGVAVNPGVPTEVLLLWNVPERWTPPDSATVAVYAMTESNDGGHGCRYDRPVATFTLPVRA